MYFHGSYSLLPIGTILTPQESGYVQSKWLSDLEQLFEKERPAHCISRNNAVFVTNNIDEIDALGGATDFIFGVDLMGENYNACDLAWYSEAESQIENADLLAAKQSAKNYWSGKKHPLYSCFEILAEKAKIVSIED